MSKIYDLSVYAEKLSEAGLFVEKGGNTGKTDCPVKYVSFNSQDIKDGTLFICKGAHYKEEYLADAVRKGACAYISEKKSDVVSEDVPYMIVKDVRKAMVTVAELFYDTAWKKLTVTGITGTKGKSSTTYYLKHILDEYMASLSKPETAVVSGIDNYDGVVKEESHLTTPEIIELYRHFDNAVNSGIEYVSMEVSSSGLKYGRVDNIIFDVGCFLNIGTDHISDIEHPDFDDYVNSKMMLFSQTKVCCVNMESKYAQKVIDAASSSEKTEKIIRFGRNDFSYDVCGYDIEASEDGISFSVKTEAFDRRFSITMHGLFNVDNALCAISAAYALGIPVEFMISGLKKARVSGRMEMFKNKAETMTVFVDYAHNQLSFESLFETIREEYPGKKIFIAYGCPGKKAFARRKELSEIAGKFADMIYITEEDPGEEPVENICREIAENVEAVGGRYEIIIDREEAIKKAISDMDEDTVLLVTGKGRETRQKRGVLYIDTPSDVEIVKEALKLK